MIGALVATINLVSFYSVIKAIRHRFKGKLAEKNEEAVVSGFNLTKVVNYE